MKAVGSIINHSDIYHERAGKCQLPAPTNTINLCSDLQMNHTQINACDLFKIWLHSNLFGGNKYSVFLIHILYLSMFFSAEIFSHEASLQK